MTKPQKRTAIVLASWCVLQLIGGLGLLSWEMYAVASPENAALITTVVKTVWASQPWAIFLPWTIVTFLVAYLMAHFTAGPKKELDEIRSNLSEK
jgi:hypothetical protein